MITHSALWSAIDSIADRYDLSPSGLARAAGLDATTFNKSKRFTTSGRERWPSTESIAKVLDATGASFDEFVSLMMAAEQGASFVGQSIPLLDMDLAGNEEQFDRYGLPLVDDWDQINFPETRDEGLYGLEVVVDDYEPVYWAGDILVVSPKAEIRRGDRVVVKFKDGRFFARHLVRKTSNRVEFSLIQDHGQTERFEAEEIAWISRIVWVRQ